MHIAGMDNDADAKMILTALQTRELEETTRASPYQVAERLQPHTERSSRPGPEPPSVEADVHVWWCYALLVVHARKVQ